jgi:hypothetical protein
MMPVYINSSKALATTVHKLMQSCCSYLHDPKPHRATFRKEPANTIGPLSNPPVAEALGQRIHHKTFEIAYQP